MDKEWKQWLVMNQLHLRTQHSTPGDCTVYAVLNSGVRVNIGSFLCSSMGKYVLQTGSVFLLQCIN